MKRAAWPLVAVAALLLPACAERSQADAARLKKADAKASSGAAAADRAYMASGWTAGDDASWQTQIRGRTQGQNEYARITSATPAAPAATPVAAAPAEPAKAP
jgi:hypothetical protein